VGAKVNRTQGEGEEKCPRFPGCSMNTIRLMTSPNILSSAFYYLPTKRKLKEREQDMAKDGTGTRIKGACHGPESSPCISAQYSPLSPKDNGRKAGETTGGKEQTRTQQADVSSGLGLN